VKNVPTNKAPSTTADLLSLSEPAAPASQPPPQVAAQQNSTLLSMSATTAQQGNTADVSLRNGKLLLGFVEVR
jgi:hypothetical protein